MKAQTVDSLVAALSDPRFETYKQQVNNDKYKALDLYLWNIDMARAVAATTGMVEVQLRNTINRALVNWNPQQSVTEPGRTTPYSSSWLRDPAPKLAQVINTPGEPPFWKKAIPALKDVSGQLKKPLNQYTNDDLVAALTFGAWTYLLPEPNATENNARKYLWNNALKFEFSAREGNNYTYESHRVIYYWSKTVQYARNRASHMEPLLNPQEVTWYHRASHRLLNSMNPAAASWLAGQNYIPNALAARPYQLDGLS